MREICHLLSIIVAEHVSLSDRVDYLDIFGQVKPTTHVEGTGDGNITIKRAGRRDIHK